MTCPHHYLAMPEKTDVREFTDTIGEETKHDKEEIIHELPPDNNEYNISRLAYCIDEIFFSGNMPDFKTYIKFKLSQTILCVEASKSFSTKAWILLKGVPFLLLYFVDIVLRGVSQVYLCNHPLCGLLICIGLWTTSFELLIFGLVGSAVSTVAGYIISSPKLEEVEAGLCG